MYKITGNIIVDNEGKEIRLHGTLAYPIASYINDMNEALVIWHWHEELELIVVTKGTIRVGAGSVEKIVKVPTTLEVGASCFIEIAFAICSLE